MEDQYLDDIIPLCYYQWSVDESYYMMNNCIELVY
jgi:hypothetical protein